MQAQQAAAAEVSLARIEGALFGGSPAEVERLMQGAMDAFESELSGDAQDAVRAAAAGPSTPRPGLHGVLASALREGARANPMCVVPDGGEQ